jgi:hypothetical protein
MTVLDRERLAVIILYWLMGIARRGQPPLDTIYNATTTVSCATFKLKSLGIG